MRRARAAGDEGVVLVLALVFMVAIGLIIGGLTNLVLSNLSTTNRLQLDRATQYAVDGAVEADIQKIRYPSAGTVYGYSDGSASACPDYVTSGSTITNGVAVKVTCSGQLSSSLTTARAVQFTACLASAANCAANPLLVALVRYTDTSNGTTQIGSVATILQWDTSPGVSGSGGLAVSGVSPNGLRQGATNKTLTITGSGFAAPASTAFSGSGITVVSTSVTDASDLSVVVSVAGTAAPGPTDVTVSSGGKSATCQACFAVTAAPTITALSPSPRGQGATNQPVTVTGTGFINGPGLSVSITGHPGAVTVTSTTFSNSTTLTLNVNVASAATVASDYGATLTNGDGSTASCTSCFAVTAGPKVTSTTPASSQRSVSGLSVQINGSNFAASATPSFANPGITLNSFTVNANNKITANINISGTAATGAVDVTVTNTADAGTGICTGCFTVTNPKITLSSPTDITTTTQTITVTATGFAPNTQLKCSINGAGAANCANPSVTDGSGSATFTFTPPTGGANQGEYTTYTVTDGTGSATATYDVAPVPTGFVLENGGTANRVDSGDTVVITWSDALAPNTICPTTWSSVPAAALPITVQVKDGGGGADTLIVTGNPCGGAALNKPLSVGTISLGATNWTAVNVNFAASSAIYCAGAAASGLCSDPNVTGPAIVIRIGGAGGAPAAGAVTGASITYAPNTAIATTVGGGFTANINPVNGTAGYPASGAF